MVLRSVTRTFVTQVSWIYMRKNRLAHVNQSRFRSLGIFGLWNLESAKFFPAKSGMLGFGIRYSAKGIWNPTDIGNRYPTFTDKKIRNRVLGIWNPQHGIQNPRLSWITLYGALWERGMARLFSDWQIDRKVVFIHTWLKAACSAHQISKSFCILTLAFSSRCWRCSISVLRDLSCVKLSLYLIKETKEI